MSRVRGALDEELGFVFRSLVDLDQEHEAGELSDDLYRELVDDYTTRAAELLAAVNASTSAARAGTPARPRARRVLTGMAALAAAAVGALLLVGALRPRAPGATVTGNTEAAVSGAEAERRALDAAVTERPDDVAARLALARALLDSGNAAAAVQQFDEVAARDPSNAEARAYAGWIVHLAGLPDEGLRRVESAIAADPAFPDSYFFRAMMLRARNDGAGAADGFRRYLELAPRDAPLRADVEAALAEVEKSGR